LRKEPSNTPPSSARANGALSGSDTLARCVRTPHELLAFRASLHKNRQPFPPRADKDGTKVNAPMIELTRLNGNPLVVNSDLIQYAESSPDTTLTLVNGEKVVVLESLTEVIDLTVAYRVRLMGEVSRLIPGPPVPASGAGLRAVSAAQAIRSSEEVEQDMDLSLRRRRKEL
jgi:flagellar protein FlbD